MHVRAAHARAGSSRPTAPWTRRPVLRALHPVRKPGGVDRNCMSTADSRPVPSTRDDAAGCILVPVSIHPGFDTTTRAELGEFLKNRRARLAHDAPVLGEGVCVGLRTELV